MGNKICIDTNIIIDHLRGRSPGADIYEDIIKNKEPYTSEITRFELLCGARNSEESMTIQDCLLGFTIVPFDSPCADMAAKIYRDLKEKGRIIGMRDILIAGTALANRLKMATLNRDEFERVKGLVLY